MRKNVGVIGLIGLLIVGCSSSNNFSSSKVNSSIVNSSSSSYSSLISSSYNSINSSSIESSSIEGSTSSISSSDSKPIENTKKWSSAADFAENPFGFSNDISKTNSIRKIDDSIGHEDKSSLQFEVKVNEDNNSFIATNLVENQYFKKGDAKNGYIISLYLYAPKDSNLSSMKLEASSLNYVDELYSEELEIKDNEEKWIRLVVTFDTIDTFKCIKLNFTAIDVTKAVKFYVDDVTISYGTPTATERRMPDHQSLYKVYEEDFKVGTCVSSYSLRNSTINTLAGRNFNSLTAENEGKPEQILDQNACKSLVDSDNTQVAIKTSSFESIYNYAESHHQKVRHHTLVWHEQTPSWFFNDNYSSSGNRVNRETMLKRLENFIKVTIETINTKWPGLVYAIDVVNEAIDGGGIRRYGNNWYSVIGSDYVYQAFKFAKKYKADYQDLYYNDYSFDYNTNNCAYAVNTLLKEAIEEKLVDGVGIQGHLSSSSNMDNIIKDAKMIYAKGLKCQITELDITISSNDEEHLERQKQAYINLVQKILKANENKETNINAVVLWGISDNYSWKSSEYPLLFDTNIKKKPAYHGFYNAKFDL